MRLDIRRVALLLAVVGFGSLFTGVSLVRQSEGYGFRGGATRPLDVKKSVAAGQVAVIDISTVSADVRWHETQESEIRIHLHGRAGAVPSELRATVEQGVLDVDVLHRSEFQLSFSPEQVFLDIYVPRAERKEVSVRTTSGNANLTAVRAEDFRFTTVSGDFTADGLATRRSRLKSTSGNFTVGGFTGDLEFNTVSGDLNLAYTSFDNEIQLKSTSGNLRVDLPDNAKFALDASSVSGEMTVEFPITVTGRQGGRQMQGAVADGQKPVHVRTVSGNLRLY